MIDINRPRSWEPSDEQKARLLDFEGYGSDDPDVVFVGLEDLTDGGIDEQREDIWIRCTQSIFAVPRTDRVGATRALNDLVKPPTVRNWDVIAAIMSGLSKRPVKEDRAAIGTRPPLVQPSTWLTNVYPLPRPSWGSFQDSYVAEWFRFRSKAEYERHGGAISGARLLRTIRGERPPRYIFFHGLPTGRWAQRELKDELVSPFQNQNDAIQISRTVHGTTIILTGVYEGQHGPTAFDRRQVPQLLARLQQAETL